MLVWIVTKIYIMGIEVEQNGVISFTPPICRWVKGRRADWFKSYLENKGTLIEWVEVDKCEKTKK